MSTSDHTDRLGLERFDAVEVPDQWADIVRRAEAGGRADSNVVAVRRRGWYLAAAASFVALIGGLVVVTQLRDDGGATPIDQPTTDGAGANECTDESDLDAIVQLLSSGLPTYDYQPAADLDALIGQNDVVVRGEITNAVRADGSLDSYMSISISATSVLTGEATAAIEGFGTWSQWPEGAGPDPLIDPVTFDGLGVIAFLSADDAAPFGWRPDIEGLIVACGDGPATGLIQTAPFLDLSSLDALETQITGIDPDTTVTTEPVSIDSVPTTTIATTDTLPEVDATVPEAAVDDRWTPTCVDRFGRGDAVFAADVGLDQFGPLGAVPGLDITLPSYRSPEQTEATEPTVVVSRVDGGVVVLARPFEGEDSDAYVLSVIDDDGAVRWRRCLDGNYAGSVLTSPGATRVTVGEYPPTNGDGAPTWHTFALDTGLDRDPFAIPADMDELVVDGPFAVFGPSGDRITTDDDRLAVLDLRTEVLGMIQFPPDLGVPAFRHEFEVIDEGSGAFRVLQRVDGQQSAVRGVWVDGVWTADAEVIRASRGVRAVLTFDERGWEGRDATGAVVWSHPDLLDIRREGFLSAESGPTTVINACREQSDAGCVDGSLVGIDTATGDIRWERIGNRGVATTGDGFAIITNDAGDGWEMIDTLTGELVDESQQWAGIEPFEQQCCGGGDVVWVGRNGGVVFAVNIDRVRVWYPQGRSDATITTSLMD